MPKVSVIITTYNRARYICEAIDSVLSQTYYDYEIIIVDDGSRGGPHEILEEYTKKYSGKVTYVYQVNKGISGARNAGIRRAKGEFVAFLDDDDVADKDWLEQIINGFLGKEVVACTPKNLSTKPMTLVQAILAFKNDNEVDDIGKNRSSFATTGTVIRSECFGQIGIFDERFSTAADDSDLAYRIISAGYKIRYVPNAVIYYRYRDNLFSLWKQRYEYGKGGINLIFKHREAYKSILNDIFTFLKRIFQLIARSVTRIFKFLIIKKNRTLSSLLEHPLSIYCLLAHYSGRLGGRIEYGIW